MATKSSLMISQHFLVSEALHTAHAGFVEKQKAWFTVERALAASRLAFEILEPLRSVVKRPIVVTSWLRCTELNRKLGGSVRSQHLTGRAADIKIPGYDLWVAFQTLDFAGVGQRILYLGNDEQPLWMHVSIPEPDWIWAAQNRCWESKLGPKPRDLICYPHRDPQTYQPFQPHNG
jgi:hypothetical protein